MFGLFRKKVPPSTPQPAPAPIAAPPIAEKVAEARIEDMVEDLTPEQKKLVIEELERRAENKGNDLDATIGLLHLTQDQIYLKGLYQFLEDAEIALLLKEAHAGSEFLILVHENLRYLPIFTRPEHARSISEKFPAYKNLAFVNTRSLFTTVQPGMGLWINPGHTVFTYIMPSATFTMFATKLAMKKTAA